MESQSTDGVEVTVSDLAFGGAGVARHEGKVYFVPFSIPGEVIRVRVIRAKKSFVEAELVSVEAASPDRVEPRCPYFQKCGGCAYQHITYGRQLAAKAAQVEQTLRRVGRLNDVPMRAIVPSPQGYAYRNRIRVHVEGGKAGFYAHGSHALIDIAECPISTPEVNAALRKLRASNPRDGDYTLSTRYGAAFFEQTNDEVASRLVETVRAAISKGQGLLVDAYCGAGFFARELAEFFEKIVGIEENPQAVEHARRQASDREHYIAGDVAAHLGDVLQAHDAQRTTVLLDPPAMGIAPRVSDILLGARPSEILYVSCNPATLARDLGILCRSAYRLEAVTPLDMFPQTAEIEAVAKLVAH